MRALEKPLPTVKRMQTGICLSAILATGFLAYTALPSVADELQGHVQQTNGPTRVTRPPDAPALESGAQTAQSSAGLNGKLDESAFQLYNRSNPSGLMGGAHWDPWRTTGILRPGYHPPLHTGLMQQDLAAVERTWPASRVQLNNGTTMTTVVVSLAMCPNPQFIGDWRCLMQELQADGGKGSWKQWQDTVCNNIARRQKTLASVGNYNYHVAVDLGGVLDSISGMRPSGGVDDPQEMIQEAIIRQSLGPLPAGTTVSVAHFRIHINSTPSMIRP